MFREEGSEVLYVTLSRNTWYEYQTTVHVRAVVNDTSGTAIVVDADVYEHSFNHSHEYVSEHEKGLSSEWLVPLEELFSSSGFYTVIVDSSTQIEKRDDKAWPFVVQHIDGFTKKPKYRVVTLKEAEEDHDLHPWTTIPDME